jgi:hypothetical protein
VSTDTMIFFTARFRAVFRGFLGGRGTTFFMTSR